MPRTKKDTAKKRTISQSPVVSEAPSLPQRKLYHQKAFQKDRLAEIVRLQKSTDLLIPKGSFQRLVKSVLLDLQRDKRGRIDPNAEEDHPDVRMESQALFALQEASEQYLVGLMEDAYACAVHNKRVTLLEKDLHLVNRLRISKLHPVVKAPP